MNVKFNNISINALIDTGASCSIIDIGSLQRIQPNTGIQPTSNPIIDASSNCIKISGAINISVRLKDVTIEHSLKLLDVNSHRNVILGRDFLSKFSVVEFNFSSNAIKLGDQWHKCVDITDQCTEGLVSQFTLKSRSESIVTVRCDPSFSLVTADFELQMSQKLPGAYAHRCRVIPNIDGYFQISLLNTTTSPVSLAANECLGSLAKIDTPVDQVHYSEVLEKRNLGDWI